MPTIIGYRVWLEGGSVIDRHISGLTVLQLQTGWEALAPTGWQALALYLGQTYQTDRSGSQVTEHDRVLLYGRRGGEVALSVLAMADLEPWSSSEANWYWFNPLTLRFGAGLEDQIPAAAVGPLRKQGSTLPDDEWWTVYQQARESRSAPVEV